MKIKTNKKFTLSQLIEWAQDNIEEATKKVYRVNENEVLGNHVRFTEVYSDLGVRLHGYIPFDTTFTVEVEEEITEDTKFNVLLVVDEDDNYFKYYNTCVDYFIRSRVKAIYIPNDDLTLTLIWRDGRLVE